MNITVLDLKQDAIQRWKQSTSAEIMTLVGLVALLFFYSGKRVSKVVASPVHGARFFFEPTILLRIRFLTSGYKIIKSGYEKVRSCIYILRMTQEE